MHYHLKFKRDIASLESIFAFLEEFIASGKIAQADAFTLNFVVEELFTNFVKYNPTSESDILIVLEKLDQKIKLEMVDPDAEPFDVTQAPKVDTQQSLQDRQIGGLGLHLVKEMVDHIAYEYKNKQSKITIMKKLSS
jgi:anti-sigma regulatory factor (Ser/Thr protein kinase)